jgi:hypothetical protein
MIAKGPKEVKKVIVKVIENLNFAYPSGLSNCHAPASSKNITETMMIRKKRNDVLGHKFFSPEPSDRAVSFNFLTNCVCHTNLSISGIGNTFDSETGRIHSILTSTNARVLLIPIGSSLKGAIIEPQNGGNPSLLHHT